MQENADLSLSRMPIENFDDLFFFIKEIAGERKEYIDYEREYARSGKL